jgi:hypothetical protein
VQFPPDVTQATEKGNDMRGHMERRLGDMDAAASYLGLPESDVMRALGRGETLAQIAEGSGESADALVDALVEAAKEEIAAAVAAERLTDSQRDAMLRGLRARVTALVNGEWPNGFGPPPERPPKDLGAAA